MFAQTLMSVMALTMVDVTRSAPTLLEATTVHVMKDLQCWEKIIPV